MFKRVLVRGLALTRLVYAMIYSKGVDSRIDMTSQIALFLQEKRVNFGNFFFQKKTTAWVVETVKYKV